MNNVITETNYSPSPEPRDISEGGLGDVNSSIYRPKQKNKSKRGAAAKQRSPSKSP